MIEGCSEGIAKLATTAVMQGRSETEVLRLLLGNGVRSTTAKRALAQARRSQEDAHRRRRLRSAAWLALTLLATTLLATLPLLPA